MAEFDDKLNAILGNPEIMSQIMSIAGTMNAASPPPVQPPPQPGLNFSPASMQGMMELIKSTQLDQKQQNLINALGGYLPADRLRRLEKAMQASKIAKYASTALANKSSQGR